MDDLQLLVRGTQRLLPHVLVLWQECATPLQLDIAKGCPLEQGFLLGLKGWASYRQRDKETETQRETERQKDRKTERQRTRERARDSERQRERERETERQKRRRKQAEIEWFILCTRLCHCLSCIVHYAITGVVVGALFWNWLPLRLGRKPLAIISILVYITCHWLQALMTSAWAMLTLRFFVGFGMGQFTFLWVLEMVKSDGMSLLRTMPGCRGTGGVVCLATSSVRQQRHTACCIVPRLQVVMPQNRKKSAKGGHGFIRWNV